MVIGEKGGSRAFELRFYLPPLMLGALRLRGRFQERCAGNSSRSGRLLVIYRVVSQDKEGQIIHLECTQSPISRVGVFHLRWAFVLGAGNKRRRRKSRL